VKVLSFLEQDALLMQDFNELPVIPCVIVISSIALSETGEANCFSSTACKIMGDRAMTEELPTASTSRAKIS
jgi:hypothetical protein